MSIFKHIRKVQEACIVHYGDGKISDSPYWELPEPAQKYAGSEEEAQDELEVILTDAVRCRMISDVPLGAFLSGGIDSSAIVAMMTKCWRQAAKTFTINFVEKSFSELEDARLVAAHCRTDHHVLEVKTDAVSLLPKLVWHFDEPFADSSAIPTYYVSKMAREHVTVILSGDGGDELFAGYASYSKRDEYQYLLRLPRSLRQKIFGKLARALPIQAPMRNLLKYIAVATLDDGPEALGQYPYIKDDVLSAPLRRELACYDPTLPHREILTTLKAADKLTRLQFSTPALPVTFWSRLIA
jgi:asparagine synthase (glutamine-hydrolysing)